MNFSQRKMTKIGLRTVLVWWVVGVALLFLTQETTGAFLSAARWFLIISLLCFVDLVAIVGTMTAAFKWTELADADPLKRSAAALQTFYWGAFKLACLGILGMILIRAQSASGLSLFLGLATLAVLSLVGGLFCSWSKNVNQTRPIEF